MRYKNVSFKKLPVNAKMLSGFGKTTGIFNIGLLAVIGLVLVWMYKKFFGVSVFGTAADKLEKDGVKNLTSRNALEGSSLDELKASLAQRGLIPNASHKISADTLNMMLDASNVDEDKILALVKSMAVPSLQCVAVVYGQRELRNYRNTHLFDSDSWRDLFSEKKLYGTLHYHLMVVLSSSDQAKISNWLSQIP